MDCKLHAAPPSEACGRHGVYEQHWQYGIDLDAVYSTSRTYDPPSETGCARVTSISDTPGLCADIWVVLPDLSSALPTRTWRRDWTHDARGHLWHCFEILPRPPE